MITNQEKRRKKQPARNSTHKKANERVARDGAKEKVRWKYEQNDSQAIYPFTRADSAKLFKNKGDKDAYDKNEVYTSIKNGLLDMQQYGFDFRCITWHFQRPADASAWRGFKIMNRKIYLKFKCYNCKDNGGRPKAWTSILGNLQIRFKKQRIQRFWKKKPSFKQQINIDEMNYPFIVKWMLKIYAEYCESCNKAGKPFVYYSQMKACQIQFCRIVAEIMNNVKLDNNRGNRKKVVQVHNHKEQFCQACHQGVCFNIPKQQQQQIRKGQI